MERDLVGGQQPTPTFRAAPLTPLLLLHTAWTAQAMRGRPSYPHSVPHSLTGKGHRGTRTSKEQSHGLSCVSQTHPRTSARDCIGKQHL